MTKDVFLCANKSKSTCGDKRECEQFFQRDSIPLLDSPKMATHSITKYIELEETQITLINIAKTKLHFNKSLFSEKYGCYHFVSLIDAIFYHEIVNFIYKQSEPY